jgi:hypothetical protein
MSCAHLCRHMVGKPLIIRNEWLSCRPSGNAYRYGTIGCQEVTNVPLCPRFSLSSGSLFRRYGETGRGVAPVIYRQGKRKDYLTSPFDTVMECKKNANWGQLVDNLITLVPIIDYNNQIADLLQTGFTG